MNESVKILIKKKHDWLISQVDVEFPTTESVSGRDLYILRENETKYVEVTDSILDNSKSDLIDELYLIDFHRLTIMFAQLQSTGWSDEKDQANVLEFFAQIMLTEQHTIYLAFKQGQAVACGIMTTNENTALFSDIVTIARPFAIAHELVRKVLNANTALTASHIFMPLFDDK